ncbi:sensor domain-containing diguanylate cyclase [Methylovorus glucosotrophus]|uniref:Diguanylate cyclase with PAS/PAC and GAF sensors n=1 Tax=Methylovorus glucosotrophus (strain SIP3-4) TaxID=582744 RepID=C6XAD7_METGS|nr:diguanylate cyclase [Methylovorus glucosotrophus]ACT51678.1 diguanylate cyclase with PAS/PAC and GAF sensors [Methylovorus glucosotrophus SIP3-4]
MKSATLPPDEAERIAMLHALGLLDTDPEPVFDRITQLVALTLNVPIALISLVDTDRQWFKSRIGVEAEESPRDVAFCAHAILQTKPMVVNDALLDERFADNPMVLQFPNIRFYAGIPIRTTAGYALGTLCAIDAQPRELSKHEMEILTCLADLVSKEIRLREALALTESHLKLSQTVLHASEARFRTIFEKAAIGIALVAPDGGWLSVNEELCRFLGYRQDELHLLSFRDITYPDDLPADLDLLKQLAEDKIDRYKIEKRYIRKDGELRWASLSVTKQINLRGELEYFVSIVKDIHDRKVAEQALNELQHELENRVAQRTFELNKSNEMLSFAMAKQTLAAQELKERELEISMVIENANDAYVSINQSGIITAWNRQAEITFGWSAREAIGQRLDQVIIPPHMQQAHLNGMQRHMDTGEAVVLGKRLELEAKHKDGHIVPVEVRISKIEVHGKHIFSAFLTDISERKHLQSLLEKEAKHDVLTGLPNRRAFTEALPLALARADRTQQWMALMFIDLDGFKQINDELGHDAGDMLLREIANRLNSATRQTDTVARFAGDEFVVLLENMPEKQHAEGVAQKILTLLRDPVMLGGEPRQISCSLGLAYYAPNSHVQPDMLLKEADNAMYEAKRSGKNQIRISA